VAIAVARAWLLLATLAGRPRERALGARLWPQRAAGDELGLQSAPVGSLGGG
jgi:hypothetical protein